MSCGARPAQRRCVIDVYWIPDAQPETQRQGYWLRPCRIAGRSVQIVADVDREELARFCSLLGKSP